MKEKLALPARRDAAIRRMSPPSAAPPAAPRARAIRLLAGAGVVLLVAGGLVAGRLPLRNQLRAQMAARDAALLHTVALLIRENDPEVRALAEAGADLADQNLAILARVTRLRDVVAARLFDAAGRFEASLPENVWDAELDEAALAELAARRPAAAFVPAARLSDVFLEPGGAAPARRAPLLFITLPLHPAGHGPLEGVIQLVLDGSGLAADCARLDRRLALETLLLTAVISGVALAVLAWAFRRLARQADELRLANAELARTARAAAVGAVTAHLLHSLKNPLAGLQSLTAGDAPPAAGAWQDAAAATRQMQELVRRVTGLLQEERHELAYEVPAGEIFAALRARLAPEAARRGVALELPAGPPAPLDNRAAALLELALANLLQNALEALPAGGRLILDAAVADGALAVNVRDTGPGLPESVRARLFTPVTSTKPGGSGIGLALAWQLLHHAGGRLELVETSAAGTVFRAWAPLRAAVRAPAHAAPAAR